MKTIITMLLCGLSVISFGQNFQKVYGSDGMDFMYSIVETDDRGFLMGGYTSTMTGTAQNMYFIRTDELGDTLWTKVLRGIGIDQVQTMVKHPDGYALFVGSSASVNPAMQMNIIFGAMSYEGELLWMKNEGGIGADYGADLKLTADGGFVVVGNSSSFSAGDQDFYVSKYDVTGEQEWVRTFGTSAYENARKCVVDEDGNIFIWGQAEPNQVNNLEGLLMKISPDGDLIFSKLFGLQENEIAWDLIINESNEILLMGDTGSSGEGMTDTFLLKCNREGEILWAKTYGGVSNDHSVSITKVNGDMYAIGGLSASFGHGGLDFALYFINDDGDYKYTTVYGGEVKDVCLDIVETQDYGLAMVGYTGSFAIGFYNPYLVKVRNDGHSECHSQQTGEMITNDFPIIASLHDANMLDIVSMAQDCFLTDYPTTGSQVNIICSSHQEYDPIVEEVIKNEIEHEDSELTVSRKIENAAPSSLQVHPNPSQGDGTINLKYSSKWTSALQVITAEGEVVMKQNLSATEDDLQYLNWNFDGLTPGVYFVQWVGRNQMRSQKLVVQ